MAVILVQRVPGADPEVALPVYESAGAAGADLRANLPEKARAGGLMLAPGARMLVPTGVRVEIPPGFEWQIRPRSGLALRHGVTLVNAPGTIDADYRGEVGVLLINLGDAIFTVVHGARIAQAVLAPVAQAEFSEVGELGETARGASGFGSTGQA